MNGTNAVGDWRGRAFDGQAGGMGKTLGLLLALSPLTAACGGSDGDLNVVSASLSGWEEFGFAIIGGFVSGDATLTFTDSAGGTHTRPVGFGGPTVGIVFDFHVGGEDIVGEGCGGASLGIPEGGVSESELFGIYSGSVASVGMAIGFVEHELENDAGVSFNAGGLSAGAGLLVGYEWWGMSEGE